MHVSCVCTHIHTPCIFNLSVGKLLTGNMEEEGGNSLSVMG